MKFTLACLCVLTAAFASRRAADLYVSPAGRQQTLARHPDFDPQNPYGGGWAHADGKSIPMYTDAPGEWYLDRATSTLYFWPPAGADPGTVFAPTLRPLLELGAGTAHVAFRGFVFEGCEGTAITLKGTNHCRIIAATIRNVGDYTGSGVAIDGGTNNGVVGCELHHIGRSAMTSSRSSGCRSGFIPRCIRESDSDSNPYEASRPVWPRAERTAHLSLPDPELAPAKPAQFA